MQSIKEYLIISNVAKAIFSLFILTSRLKATAIAVDLSQRILERQKL